MDAPKMSRFTKRVWCMAVSFGPSPDNLVFDATHP
jgi:hypothetical protein